MFAANYFAPRYFAPTYWPKVGADVVDTGSGSVGATGVWQWWAKEYNRKRAEQKSKVKVIGEPVVKKQPIIFARIAEADGIGQANAEAARLALRAFKAATLPSSQVADAYRPIVTLYGHGSVVAYRVDTMDVSTARPRIAVLDKRFVDLERKLRIMHEDYDLLGIS